MKVMARTWTSNARIIYSEIVFFCFLYISFPRTWLRFGCYISVLVPVTFWREIHRLLKRFTFDPTTHNKHIIWYFSVFIKPFICWCLGLAPLVWSLSMIQCIHIRRKNLRKKIGFTLLTHTIVQMSIDKFIQRLTFELNVMYACVDWYIANVCYI